MNELNFTVETNDGIKLSATLHKKSNEITTVDKGVVVLCHGLLNTRNSNVIRTLVEGIKNHDCISFDFQGNGLSEGTTSN